jgi:hypothetical protein
VLVRWLDGGEVWRVVDGGRWAVARRVIKACERAVRVAPGWSGWERCARSHEKAIVASTWLERETDTSSPRFLWSIQVNHN